MIPPFTHPDPTGDGPALAAYLTEHVGGVWCHSTVSAYATVGGLPVSVYAWCCDVRVGPVSVAVVNGNPALAIPILRDPAALRTRVREELARALATIDTEPTS